MKIYEIGCFIVLPIATVPATVPRMCMQLPIIKMKLKKITCAIFSIPSISCFAHTHKCIA